jgi:hypothetical protein
VGKDRSRSGAEGGGEGGLSGRVADPEARFAVSGNQTVFLTSDAALRVCAEAAARGLLVYRIEGGIWREGRGCEMRLGAIWDSQVDPPIAVAVANTNNLRLASMVRNDPESCDTFVVSMMAIERKLARLDG